MLICIELRGAGPLRQHSRDARRAGLPQRWRPHRPGTEHQRPGRMVALLSAWKTGTQNFLTVQPIRKSIRSCYCWQRIGIQWELGDRIGSVPPPHPTPFPLLPSLGHVARLYRFDLDIDLKIDQRRHPGVFWCRVEKHVSIPSPRRDGFKRDGRRNDRNGNRCPRLRAFQYVGWKAIDWKTPGAGSTHGTHRFE